MAGRRPRLSWLWAEYGAKKAAKKGVIPPRPERAPGTKPRVNLIGPAYGTFNMPSDLARSGASSRASGPR